MALQNGGIRRLPWRAFNNSTSACSTFSQFPCGAKTGWGARTFNQDAWVAYDTIPSNYNTGLYLVIAVQSCFRALNASLTGTCSVSASLKPYANLASSITGSCAVAGSLKPYANLASSINCSATVSATLSTYAQLSAAIACACSVSANLSAYAALNSSIAPSVSISANLTTIAELNASINPQASVSANLTTYASLSSSINPAASLSANLTSFVCLNASITGSVNVSASLSTYANLTASISPNVAVAGTMSAFVEMTAGIDCSVDLLANLTIKLIPRPDNPITDLPLLPIVIGSYLADLVVDQAPAATIAIQADSLIITSEGLQGCTVTRGSNMVTQRIFNQNKAVNETRFYTFDFRPGLRANESISSAVISITVEQGTDPDPDDMINGSYTNDNGLIIQSLTGGLAGTQYNIQAAVTTSMGQELDLRGLLNVIA